MAGRLQGKVALITGGASGIGRAAAELFAREGARVVAADINTAGAEKTAATIGRQAIAVRLDVSQEADWEAATARTVREFGRLDIVANVAGIGFYGSIEDLEMSQWQAMLGVNLTGVVLGCKHGVRTIRASGGSGAIINVSALGGIVGVGDFAGYCATKGGVTTLTKSVALHCAAQRLPIRCLSVHPTYVDTEMMDPVVAAFASRQALLEQLARFVPMGRVATALDVANVMLFAASEEAAMVSGSALLVDGAQLAGWTAIPTEE
jgi:NAD(P)-dependent dehydrogenase (short-subunit alcohol dehydrogenase family)